MNLISFVGLFALLGIAWLLSYHRKDVRPRTVIWGVGLQLLFAVIILRQDSLSFMGMAVLGLLITTYLQRQPVPLLGKETWKTVALLAAAAVVGVAAWQLAAPILPYALLLLVVFMVVNSRFSLVPDGGRWAAIVFVVIGVAFLVSRDLYGQVIFASFSDKVAEFLSLSDYGAQFLFGNLANAEHYFPGDGSVWPGFGFQFGFKVLPTIIFFGGFMSVLYYLGIMQKVIQAMAGFMRWTIGTSGAETLSCSANIFVGQTEAPLLIKPFIDKMTRSELLTIMVGGFATIAGGVLAGYIAMGVPAGHLVAASVMSAPAALVIGKIIFPEKEQSATAGDVEMPEIDAGSNVIEAATNGISDGLKLAVNVGAMLIGFIALIAVVDMVLNGFDSLIDGSLLGGTRYAYQTTGLSPAVGEFEGYFPGSLQTLFGTILRPLAWLIGVPWADAAAVGNLLGIKLSLNEFVAFGTLGTYIQNGALDERSVIIATYALCGFANFSSIGIQIGGISAVAPRRKSALAKVGLRAMFGGALASWLTATIAGILVQ